MIPDRMAYSDFGWFSLPGDYSRSSFTAITLNNLTIELAKHYVFMTDINTRNLLPFSQTETFIMAGIKEDIFMPTSLLNKCFISISDFHYENIIDFEW